MRETFLAFTSLASLKLCNVECWAVPDHGKDRVPVIFYMLEYLDLRFSDIAIVVPNLRTLRLAFLGIGLTRMFVSMFRHNIGQVTVLELDWHHSMSHDIVVLNIFPNLTSLDLSHCRNRVMQEATNGLASPELHLPNLERIRVG
jgi:hypothetical protein